MFGGGGGCFVVSGLQSRRRLIMVSLLDPGAVLGVAFGRVLG